MKVWPDGPAELGQHWVTVNVVHPGLTLTEKYDGTISLPAERLAAAAAGTAIRRVVTADEIAAGGGTPGPIHY
ncbi:hypothetical protein [Frankia sp. Cas3]|uniref:hypothetical protein n=1 Tax=Frankia sp. Cas3 TaxID=3073926 RepID=UPI002AD43B22|nr:hypothetical protein [Frankia sp. Cas3]